MDIIINVNKIIQNVKKKKLNNYFLKNSLKQN